MWTSRQKIESNMLHILQKIKSWRKKQKNDRKKTPTFWYILGWISIHIGLDPFLHATASTTGYMLCVLFCITPISQGTGLPINLVYRVWIIRYSQNIFTSDTQVLHNSCDKDVAHGGWLIHKKILANIFQKCRNSQNQAYNNKIYSMQHNSHHITLTLLRQHSRERIGHDSSRVLPDFTRIITGV